MHGIPRIISESSLLRGDLREHGVCEEEFWRCYRIVIVWKLDRFSRKRYDLAKYKAVSV